MFVYLVLEKKISSYKNYINFKNNLNKNIISVIAEIIDVTIPIPADGPSFGVAPSGTWIWKSFLSNIGGIIP